MKRKRDFCSEDQYLKNKKKQKCQNNCYQAVAKKECETIEIYDLEYEDVTMVAIAMEAIKTLDGISYSELTLVRKNADENIPDNKLKTVELNGQSLEIIDEEEHADAISIGLTTIVTPTPSLYHIPDLLTPTLLLLLFNIIQPSLDLYRDLVMLFRLSLYPEHWGWGYYLFSGVLLNFLFTCRAWWRLEPREDKSWTWILLILQVQQKEQGPTRHRPMAHRILNDAYC